MPDHQGPGRQSREVFAARFRERFADVRFGAHEAAVAELEEVAWQNYQDRRKPGGRVRAAGEGFADPTYELATTWFDTRDAIAEAAREQARLDGPTRVLLIAGGPRNERTCPSEISKSFRLAEIIRETAVAQAIPGGDDGVEVDVLDLSWVTSDHGLTIHPCKGCVSTAMPMCHWPCSCYPNHALGQVHDWMNEIYPRWTRAHAVVIVTPVHWFQAPTTLKLMMDRMVCADGGNPDPTSTHGKKPDEAKALEANWPYPRHLEGRVYGLVVHGDTEGAESLRTALARWLDAMGLISAGAQAVVDRYIGYYEPYGTAHQAFDRDRALHEEARNVARLVVGAARKQRRQPAPVLEDPRPK